MRGYCLNPLLMAISAVSDSSIRQVGAGGQLTYNQAMQLAERFIKQCCLQA